MWLGRGRHAVICLKEVEKEFTFCILELYL